MGAWAYCHKCEAALHSPEVEDIVAGRMFCYACHEEREVDSDYKTALLVQMHENIAKLQVQVEILTRAVKLMAKQIKSP